MWDGTVRRKRPEKVCRDALANRLSRRRRRRRRRETRADPREKKFLHFPHSLSLFPAAALYSRERSNGSVYTFRFWAEWDGGEDEEEEEATLSGPHFPPSWRKPAARRFSFPSLGEEPPPPGVELMHALLLFLRLCRCALFARSFQNVFFFSFSPSPFSPALEKWALIQR